jgi:hypothetical protein
MRRKILELICFGAISLPIFAGCSRNNNYCWNFRNKDCAQIFDSSPIDAIEQSTLPLLNDPDIINYYKKYFPNGKPGLSLEKKSKIIKTRFFINGKTNFKEGFNYGVLAGVEVRY